MKEGVPGPQEEKDREQVPFELLDGDGSRMEHVPGDCVSGREENHGQGKPRHPPADFPVEGVDEAGACPENPQETSFLSHRRTARTGRLP